MPTLEDHELAAIFPLMADADLDALGADIEANGLRDPIWLFEGKILDGRNRYRACVARDIDHRVEHYKGKDPLAFVMSKNLHRRHLTESQRGVVAARFANLQIAHKPVRESVEEAAAALNVSPRTVDAAREVVSSGVPDLIAAVEAGEVSVSAAAEVAGLPPEEQQEAVENGTVAEKAKERRKARAKPPKPSKDPEEEEPEPETTVSHASAGKLLDVARSITRHFRRAQEEFSGMLAGDFSQELRNLAESYTGCKFYDTGETIQQTFHGGTTIGTPKFSNDSLDNLLGFCGGLKQLLARIDARPVGADDDDAPAPWDAADYDAALRSDDDTVPI